MTSGALSVRNSSSTEVLRVGNITGKAGVPSGTQFGLWGLGTGVFIQGVPRIIDVVRIGATAQLYTISNTSYTLAYVSEPRANFTVPAGKVWTVVSTGVNFNVISTVGKFYTGGLRSYLGAQRSGGSYTTSVFEAGSYINAEFIAGAFLRAEAAAPVTQTMNINCTFLIFEMDA